jgi:hypothetical protein
MPATNGQAEVSEAPLLRIFFAMLAARRHRSTKVLEHMKLSFVQKLWLPLILSLLCLAGISIYEVYRTKETRLDERKEDLTHATELALSVVKTFGDQVAAGSMKRKHVGARWIASATCVTAKTAISRSSIRTGRF